jgi:hypothetical protein
MSSVLYTKEFMTDKFKYPKPLGVGSSHPEHKKLIRSVMKKSNVKTVFDSGCAKGNNFTYFFVCNVPEDGMVYSTDINPQNYAIAYWLYSEGAFKEYHDRIQFFCQSSVEVMQRLADVDIDMFFIDSVDNDGKGGCPVADEFELIMKHWPNAHIFAHDWNRGKGKALRKYRRFLVKTINDKYGLGYFKL